MSKAKGKKGNEAELLVKTWLEANGWTVHRAAQGNLVRLPGRAPFTKSHDLFGCLDLLAIKPGGIEETWAVQVTTQNGRTARRRKLEGVAWPVSWKVSLVSHETTEDPANRRRRSHFLKVEDYMGDARWGEPQAAPIDLEGLAKWRRSRAAE